MKMNRLLALVLAFVMCFLLIACDQPAKDDEIPSYGTATPTLYRVSDKDGHVIWLLGSIHVGRENYYPLPSYVQDAFDQADSLAVELDVLAFEKDMNLQIEALSLLVYQDGSTIKDHIPPALYDRAVSILNAHHSYAPALDYYSPVFWNSMIESLMVEEIGGNINLGVDRHLINKAYDSKKEILEIESASFQYGILAALPDDVQQMLLNTTVQAYENKTTASNELTALMDLWALGDESGLVAYLNATDNTMSAEEKQAYEQYEQVLVVNRNLTMTDFAEDVLRAGKEVFICVGAAHVVGDGAMTDLLAQRGYTVERITK